eukprot:scaffold189_cov110-Skeletonema_marinoi.AAC.3
MTAARGNRSNLATLSLIIAAAAGLLTAVVTITVASPLRSDDQQRRQLTTNNEDEPPIEEQSLIAMQFTANPYAGRDKIEMIKSGEAKLASLRLTPDSLSEGNGRVYGTFCVFDDQLNKKDPAVYPTVDHMVQTSDHCNENRYTLPLDEVVEAVTSHDSGSIRSERLKKLPLSGMLFHQGFSGAGLIANALTTFDNTV